MPQFPFYDDLTPLYHFVYADWDASIARQAAELQSVIAEHWGDGGLAQRGFTVTASDLSVRSIERARQEASKRGVTIDFSAADMRRAFDHHRRGFDVVIACDNAIPHLLSSGIRFIPPAAMW